MIFYIRNIAATQEGFMNGQLIIHIVIMSAGIILLAIGAFIGATDKGEKKLSLHKAFGILGTLVFLIGAIGLLITGNLRMNLAHFYLALAAVLFLILSIIGGIAYTKADTSKKPGLRKSHKADVAIAFLLILVTMIFGITSIKLLK